MRAHVDWQRCRGHAQCIGIAPDIFTMDDAEDRAVILTEEVAPENEATVRRAALGCPEEAIVLETR